MSVNRNALGYTVLSESAGVASVLVEVVSLSLNRSDFRIELSIAEDIDDY